jgi:hypothetical protein
LKAEFAILPVFVANARRIFVKLEASPDAIWAPHRVAAGAVAGNPARRQPNACSPGGASQPGVHHDR